MVHIIVSPFYYKSICLVSCGVAVVLLWFVVALPEGPGAHVHCVFKSVFICMFIKIFVNTLKSNTVLFLVEKNWGQIKNGHLH